MEVVEQLPKRLVRFFAQYPPSLYSAKFTGVTIPLTRAEAKIEAEARAKHSGSAVAESPIPLASITSSQDPNASQTETTIPAPAPTSRKDRFPPNPFMPFRNPETGRWRGAQIGLRRQADLVKLAKKYGLEPLLPPSRKSTTFKERKILERGLRIKGTGEGQKVKGHKWERTMSATLEKRRKAMEEMPEMIREWKQRGHGRGWKKYPRAGGK